MTKTEAIKIVRHYFPKARVVKQKFNQYSGSNWGTPVIIEDYEISYKAGKRYGRFAFGAKTPEEIWVKAAESILKNKATYDRMIGES